MKEITRIHIAKYPYDIEVQAKKELESYIKNLEFYNDDDNFLEDIEIRMTEILAERDIEKNGLIASADVAALKEQLGEPKEIWGEGDIAVGPSHADVSDRPRRRLYRDLDGAVLGGVLSGIAKYFDVSAIWTRIIFLVILAASFGAAVIVYALLWIIIPPARTAAEKLESAGKPVTLASIKEVSADETENHVAPTVQTTLRYIVGISLIIGALGAIAMTIVASLGLSHRVGWFGPQDIDYLPTGTWGNWALIGLFAAAGLLLASLLTLLAVALFKKKWAKRLTIATIIIVIGGALSFGGAIGYVGYTSWQHTNQMENSRTVVRDMLPIDFKNVTTLLSDTTVTSLPQSNLPVTVNYIVSSGSPRYEMTSANQSVKPVVHITGNSATVTVSAKNDVSDYYVQPTLTIYGPALTNITVKSGSLAYSNNATQDSLNVSTLSQQANDSSQNGQSVAGSFTLLGTYTNVSAATDLGSSAMLDQATIENLTAKLTSGYMSAGVVRSLIATEPDVCPTTDTDNGTLPRIVVRGVSSGTMTFNSQSQTASTKTSTCAVLIIGSETDYDNAHEL